MSESITLLELSDFIIKREESSAELFLIMAEKTKNGFLKQRFEEFYVETVRRLGYLSDFRKNQGKNLSFRIPLNSVKSYLVDIQLREQFNDSQALALTILRAETSERLYHRMESLVEDSESRALFHLLHEEIGAHRIRCNALYDQNLGLESTGDVSDGS